MIRRCTIADIDFVNRIIGHESVYPTSSDDSPDEHRYKIGEIYLKVDAVYVLSTDDETVFIYIPHNLICYEQHTAVLPDGRGRRVLENAREAVEWMFTRTPCLKIMTWVPSFNRAASIFALRFGFCKEGVLSQSFQKNGQIYDQYLYGLTKETFKCQQQQS